MLYTKCTFVAAQPTGMGLSRNLCTINHGLIIISQLTNPAVAEQVVERERFNKRGVTFRISGAEQSVYLILTLWRYGMCWDLSS